jgi:hypothetical protein
VTLEYTAGPDCPDAVDLKGIVIARLGRDPFIESAPDHVLVRIAPRGGSLGGRIEWRDAAGKWAGDQAFSIPGTDCPGLVRAMGFAVAVQIQLLATAGAPADDKVVAPEQPGPPPQASGAQPAATPPVSAAPSNEATTAATVTNVPPPPPRGGAGSVFAIGAGPSVGFGMSSKPILLGRLFGALAWQHISLELAALVSVPATTRRPDGAGFSQQHLLVSAAACAVRNGWNACLVANAGQVRMVGDIDRPTSAWAPIVEAGARLGFVQSLGRRTFLSAHADGLINLIRWTGSLDDVAVWTAPRFAAAIAVDAGVRFP